MSLIHILTHSLSSLQRQRASTASTSGRAGKAAQQQEESKELFDRRTAALQNLAYSPIKQVLMTSFMMYMAGSNLHFFSILTVINGMYSPVNAILKSGASFRSIPGSKVDVLMPRILFCGIHLLGFLFALYRVNLMGLLPTHVSDWLSLIHANRVAETSVSSL